MTDIASKSRIAERGSQLWMQRAVALRHRALEQMLADAVGQADAAVDWRSPLTPQYAEARDGRVFELLGRQPVRRALRDFWPSRGPVWDALAVVGDRYVLIEAKAHIPELISGGSKATDKQSLATITASLEHTRKSLAPRSRVDWARSPFFQYANRLSFLQFLREDNDIPAHLAFIYFTNDSVMGGPSTDDEWRGALRLMDASLGISAHRLSPFVHKLFVDSRTLDVAVT
jgi:hypothetical protein